MHSQGPAAEAEAEAEAEADDEGEGEGEGEEEETGAVGRVVASPSFSGTDIEGALFAATVAATAALSDGVSVDATAAALAA